MNILRTLLSLLALTTTAVAQNEQLNFLIEPGAFRPGHFSTSCPTDQDRMTLSAKAREAKAAVETGLAGHSERLEAEQAELYGFVRLSKGSNRPKCLRKLVDKSRELQDHLALQAKNGVITTRKSLAANVKTAYYTAALQEDSASANALLKAAEAYLQETEQHYKNGMADRVEVLLAEITVQEATLMNSKGANAAATQKKYDELAELLSARARNGLAPAAPAEQAAEAARLFAREWARYRKLRNTHTQAQGSPPRKRRR